MLLIKPQSMKHSNNFHFCFEFYEQKTILSGKVRLRKTRIILIGSRLSKLIKYKTYSNYFTLIDLMISNREK